jgi:hypothetical protein
MVMNLEGKWIKWMKFNFFSVSPACSTRLSKLMPSVLQFAADLGGVPTQWDEFISV